MKNRLLLVLVVQLVLVSSLRSQLNPVKKFDYKLLENKVLYIPELELDSKYAKKLMKMVKFDKLQTKEAQVAEYNRVWNEAMAQSSYDATPYEIRAFEAKKILKEKNKKAIILRYFRDKYGNWFAQFWVASPKKQMIAQSIINGLDLGEVSDVKLMINMLNFALNEAIELEEEGSSTSRKQVINKYKRNFVEFYDNISDKTFLVQKNESENEKKAIKKNKDLAETLKKEWTLSKYELVSSEEIEKRRLNGESDSFYWRNFNYYTKQVLMTYRFTFLFTTERDEVLAFFYYLGSKKLKPSTLKKIQDKIIKKGDRYKKQLKN